MCFDPHPSHPIACSKSAFHCEHGVVFFFCEGWLGLTAFFLYFLVNIYHAPLTVPHGMHARNHVHTRRYAGGGPWFVRWRVHGSGRVAANRASVHHHWHRGTSGAARFVAGGCGVACPCTTTTTAIPAFPTTPATPAPVATISPGSDFQRCAV